MKFGFASLGLAGLLALGACSVAGQVFGDAGADDASAGAGKSDTAASKPEVGAEVAPVDAPPEADAAVMDAPAAEAAPDTRYGDSMVTLPSHPSCAFGRQPLKHVPPELMLVLDRSGSMSAPLMAGGATKWRDMRDALEVVINNTTSSVRWGLKFFPTESGCEVSDGVEVAPEAGNNGRTISAISNTEPNKGPSGTPMQAGLSASTRYLLSRHSENPQFMVLATDGLPSCPDGPGGAQGSLEAVMEAAKANISTFVLGIVAPGTPESQVLTDLALAGELPSPGAEKYFTVSTKDSLIGALGQIAKRITNCVFGFDIAPPSPPDVAVYVDGVRLGPEAWGYAGNLSIEIKGNACERLLAGTAETVEMILGCPGVPVP